MSQSYDFYTARADASAIEAENAVLANVKERALRSEDAWRKLASRARAVDAKRTSDARAKALLKIAEAEAASAAA